MYNVYENAYRELGSFSWATDVNQSYPSSILPLLSNTNNHSKNSSVK